MAFCAHINVGQREELSQSEIFQFARLNDGSYYFEFMEVMSTKAILRYTSTSRLYVARLLRNYPDDLYALRKIMHQLPQPLGSPYQPLSADDFRDIQAHTGENTELTNLIQYLFEYKEALPIHVCMFLSHVVHSTLTCIRLNRGTGRLSGRRCSISQKPAQQQRQACQLWVAGGYPRDISRWQWPARKTTVCAPSPNGYTPASWIMHPRPHY
jgi:hypothetical protein